MFDWDGKNMREVANNNVRIAEAEEAVSDIGWCPLGWNEITGREKGVGRTQGERFLFALVKFGEISTRVLMARDAAQTEVELYKKRKCEGES